MPGTQPRGTYSFDPGSSSSHSTTQMINAINVEEDDAEDQVDPPLDSSVAGLPAALPVASTPFPVTSDSGVSLSRGIVSSNSGISSSVVSSVPSLDPNISSSSGGTELFPSSSLAPTVFSHPIQQRDISMRSAHSLATDSDATSSQVRKRKYDARSISGAQPPSSKRASKSKTDNLNPVIISNALNSTLNRLADVMEKSLDTTTTTAPSSIAPPIVIAPTHSSTHSQPLPTSNPSSASALLSSDEVLDQAIRVTMVDEDLTEDELLAASMFFTSASEDAIRAARTFMAFGNNQVVQRRFLLRQLNMVGLLPGKDGDDHSMIC